MRSQETVVHGGPTSPDPDIEYRPPSAQPLDQCARELVRRLREYGPQNTTFDGAVRRFVRARRSAGGELESVVGELRALVRDQVAPSLAPAYRERLATGVLWFAVSEFHRAD